MISSEGQWRHYDFHYGCDDGKPEMSLNTTTDALVNGHCLGYSQGGFSKI